MIFCKRVNKILKRKIMQQCNEKGRIKILLLQQNMEWERKMVHNQWFSFQPKLPKRTRKLIHTQIQQVRN